MFCLFVLFVCLFVWFEGSFARVFARVLICVCCFHVVVCVLVCLFKFVGWLLSRAVVCVACYTLVCLLVYFVSYVCLCLLAQLCVI